MEEVTNKTQNQNEKQVMKQLVNDLWYKEDTDNADRICFYIKSDNSEEEWVETEYATTISALSAEELLKTGLPQFLMFKHVIVPNVVAIKKGINESMEIINRNRPDLLLDNIKEGYADAVIQTKMKGIETSVLIYYIDRSVGDVIRQQSLDLIAMQENFESDTLYGITLGNKILTYTGWAVNFSDSIETDLLLDHIMKSQQLMFPTEKEAIDFCDKLNCVTQDWIYHITEDTRLIGLTSKILSEFKTERQMNGGYKGNDPRDISSTYKSSAALLNIDAVINDLTYEVRSIPISYAKDEKETYEKYRDTILSQSQLGIKGSNDEETDKLFQKFIFNFI